MSKAVKKIFKAVKKTVKWVAKNIVPILAVAAIIYTGGAALGYFQGAAGGIGAGGGILGGGQLGTAGIQAAWGQTLSAGAAINAAAPVQPALAGATAAETAAATAATSVAPLTIPTSGLMTPTMSAAQMAAPTAAGVVNTGLGAGTVGKVIAGAGKAAGTAGKFIATPGGGIATAVGLQAGGAYLQSTAEEDARREELDRFNRETTAYGINRYGEQVGPTDQQDFTQDFTFNPGSGLMAPNIAPPRAPTPTTIDELIAARQQQARA